MTQDTFLSLILLSKSIQIPSLKSPGLAFLSPLVPWQGQSRQLCTWLPWPPSHTTIRADTDVDCWSGQWWAPMGVGFVELAGPESVYPQGAFFALFSHTCWLLAVYSMVLSARVWGEPEPMDPCGAPVPLREAVTNSENPTPKCINLEHAWRL